MVPYEPALITKLLRHKTDAQLAAATPLRFQTWPCDVTIPAPAIAELIANEKARRRAAR